MFVIKENQIIPPTPFPIPEDAYVILLPGIGDRVENGSMSLVCSLQPPSSLSLIEASPFH